MMASVHAWVEKEDDHDQPKNKAEIMEVRFGLNEQ
jgi:hypothetical protein